MGHRGRRERGTATIWVLGMTTALLATAGLVLDGGNALNERMALADDVEQAARAGALEIDEVHLRATDEVVIDQAAASARSRQFLADRGYRTGTVVVVGETIRVEARETVTTHLLSLVGVDQFEIRASATATAVTR